MSGQDGKAKQGLTAPKLPILGGLRALNWGRELRGCCGSLRKPLVLPAARMKVMPPSLLPNPKESQTKSYPRLEWGKRELGILGKVFSWRCLASGHGKSFCKQVRVQQDPVLLRCWKKNWRPPRQREKGEGEKGVQRL